MRGPQRDIPQTLSNNHPIASVADAEAYVARLHAIRSYLDSVVEGPERQAARGLGPPAFSIPLVVGHCEKLPAGAPFEPRVGAIAILADLRAHNAALALSDRKNARRDV